MRDIICTIFGVWCGMMSPPTVQYNPSTTNVSECSEDGIHWWPAHEIGGGGMECSDRDRDKIYKKDMIRVRISSRSLFLGTVGQFDWVPADQREALQEFVDEMNSKHPDLQYWIEHD